MAAWLRLGALVMFGLAAVSALPPTGRLARVPWIALGLGLWLAAVMVDAGDFHFPVKAKAG